MKRDDIEDILNNIDKNIDELTSRAYNELLRLIKKGLSPQEAQKAIKDALATINDKSAEIIATSLSVALGGNFSSSYVQDFEANGVKLSKRLYNNAKDVSAKTQAIINKAIKSQKTIKAIAMLLYEGYDFKTDPLKVKQKGTIPKWLKEELNRPPSKRSFYFANKIKTPALRAAYLEAIKSKDLLELNKNLKRAFYEKSRYYASRIAQNEVSKAYNIKRAKMILDDDNIEVVRVRMSRTHPRADICDYHAGVDKYGLGKGVYPKELAPIAPFHPFCRCRLVEDITRSAKDAKLNKKADREFLKEFDKYDQALILGSRKRLEKFNKSGDLLKSAYLGKPIFIKDIGGVKALGHNVKMENILNVTSSEKSFIKIWTKDRVDASYSNIRKYIGGIAMDEKSKEQAQVLLKMFEKYDSDYPKDKPIYRAIRFKKEHDIHNGIFKKLSDFYQGVYINKEVTLIDKAPSSFSKSISVAKKFGSFKDKRYYTVLFIAKNRKSNELDIEKMSHYPEQKEIIVQTHKAKYKVTDYKMNDTNDVLTIELEEVI